MKPASDRYHAEGCKIWPVFAGQFRIHRGHVEYGMNSEWYRVRCYSLSSPLVEMEGFFCVFGHLGALVMGKEVREVREVSKIAERKGIYAKCKQIC